MRVVVGITGGIAAYKAVALIRLLTEAGHEVKVIPTANALRFVGAATLEAISHNTVDPDLYTDVADVKHIELAQSADLIIVAPATGSFVARTAAGIADDLLSNVVLASSAPVVVAPAMHTEMWTNPATQQNVLTLQSRGVRVMSPASGRLTGSDTGIGRLPEPEEILRFAMAAVVVQDLFGKSFVVTAGGTQEPLDPVRYLGNRSSGKQGIAIAREASARGARVVLIAANLAVSEPFETIHVRTSQEMANALESIPKTTDCIVMAAAIGDFRAEVVSDHKIKKSDNDEGITLSLLRTPDLLAETASRLSKASSKCVVVGFAAETAGTEYDLESLAKVKLLKKGCHLVVANDVANGKVFGSDHNDVLLVQEHGQANRVIGSKAEVASAIVDTTLTLMAQA
jgi:phosphopantothenoylcysteine decarboxylase/phosphopantothenate--cysteine ligase